MGSLRDLFYWRSTIRDLRSVIKSDDEFFVEDAAILQEINKLNSRRELVKAGVLSAESPAADRPFIEFGFHTWKYVDEPLYLDFLFPDVPLAVIVSDVYCAYDALPEAMDRQLWQSNISSVSAAALACKRAKVPLLIVGPNDPVDAKSIALQVTNVLEQRGR